MEPILDFCSVWASFDLKIALIFPIKFLVNWTSSSGYEGKIDFQHGHHGGHLGFQMRRILAIYDLQVAPILPTKFRVNWPFGSAEEALNTFLDGHHSGHRWFLIGTILSVFLKSANHLDTSYQVWSQLPIWFRRQRAKQFFNMVAMVTILDFKSKWF